MARIDNKDTASLLRIAQQSGYRAGVFAVNLGVSQRQLQRYMQERFGCSTQVWLTQERLRAARELLKHGRLSVKAVALELGYKYDNYFSSQFARHYGQTPTDFLAENGEKQRVK